MTALAALVLPEEVDSVWPRVSHLIKLGLKASAHTFAADDLPDFLKRGDKQLWLSLPNADCALVTQIEDWPRGRVLHIFVVAGKLPKRWLEILSDIEAWGKERGCNRVQLRGRWGWMRKLKGYSTPRVFMEKDLSDA